MPGGGESKTCKAVNKLNTSEEPFMREFLEEVVPEEDLKAYNERTKEGQQSAYQLLRMLPSGCVPLQALLQLLISAIEDVQGKISELEILQEQIAQYDDAEIASTSAEQSHIKYDKLQQEEILLQGLQAKLSARETIEQGMKDFEGREDFADLQSLCMTRKRIMIWISDANEVNESSKKLGEKSIHFFNIPIKDGAARLIVRRYKLMEQVSSDLLLRNSNNECYSLEYLHNKDVIELPQRVLKVGQLSKALEDITDRMKYLMTKHLGKLDLDKVRWLKDYVKKEKHDFCWLGKSLNELLAERSEQLKVLTKTADQLAAPDCAESLEGDLDASIEIIKRCNNTLGKDAKEWQQAMLTESKNKSTEESDPESFIFKRVHENLSRITIDKIIKYAIRHGLAVSQAKQSAASSRGRQEVRSRRSRRSSSAPVRPMPEMLNGVGGRSELDRPRTLSRSA